jgi:UDP-N-acetylglucosamine 4,6-dehydratase
MKKKFNLLITGGTGSFGKAVLNRYINKPEINKIKIFSRDEEKQYFLRKEINNSKIEFFIGDVRNYNSILNAIKDVDLVFHAAALKQVPSCEFFPIEAVETNIYGTENVINASIKYGVKKVIILSTDKAVYPINAMGMSKALMEKVMIAKSRFAQPKTIICATRYGNVMGSRGSIIPVIIEQIKKKNFITITDKKMTRFMMSLDDAVDLVEYAYKNGKPGDIFIPKAPASNMLELAKALKNIFRSKSKIKFIGVRHGEKIYETLVNKEEKLRCRENKKFFIIPADNRSLNYDKFLSKGHQKIDIETEYNSNNTRTLKGDELEKVLLKLEIIKEELKANLIS